ncbi:MULTISPECIES: hypothetical protein [Microcoleaceae]|nr:hypothetical protein [Tychonema sp. LEGE 06208]MBE9161427.1 hypothetical protein [Tychonema sp. LEGE 06208]
MLDFTAEESDAAALLVWLRLSVLGQFPAIVAPFAALGLDLRRSPSTLQ